MYLRGDEAGLVHERERFLERPVVLIELDDGEFQEHAFETLEAFGGAHEHLLLIALRINLQECVIRQIGQNIVQPLDFDRFDLLDCCHASPGVRRIRRFQNRTEFGRARDIDLPLLRGLAAIRPIFRPF